MAQRARLYIISALIFIMLFIALIGGGTQFASAAASSFSDVLDDLNRDRNFNYEDFPPDTEDYSLQVIQIAESEQGELLIYVYQPACRKDLLASSINIAQEPNDKDKELEFKNYSLEYLNSTGTLFKYRVQDFKITSDKIRCYNIPTIFRKWNGAIDGEPENAPGNYITQVAFEVGKCWYAQAVDGDVIYSMQETETIQITSKYISFIRYFSYRTPDWFEWVFGLPLDSNDFVEAWYVAFDTDKSIDLLLEAEVYYTTSVVIKNTSGTNIPLEREPIIEEHTDVLKYDDKSKVELPNDLWGNTYSHSWSLIQSVETFKTSEDLGDVEGLSDKKWVLRFYQCLFDFNDNSKFGVIAGGSIVEELTILRLKFLSNGRVYNLGSVDNVQAADKDKKPDKEYRPTSGCNSVGGGCVGIDITLVWVVLGILAVIILLPVLSALLPVFGQALKDIFSVVWRGLKALFNGILWVISAPFRVIAALFKKRDKK